MRKFNKPIARFFVLLFSGFSVVFGVVRLLTGSSDYYLYVGSGTFGIVALVMWMIVDVMKGPSIMIRPGEHFEAFAAVTEILSNAQKFLKIIDPHTGLRTLLAIESAPKEIEIKLLTTPYVTGEDPEKVKVQVRELMNLRPELDVRSDVSKKDNKVDIGSRHLLTYPHGWKLGTSIKDIGKKQTFIDPMSIRETEEMVQWFDEEWEKSYSYIMV